MEQVTRNYALNQGLRLYEKDASDTKLLMYHKIVQENTPTDLKEHLPPPVSSTNPYHRRRPLQRQVPKQIIFPIDNYTVEYFTRKHTANKINWSN